MKQLIGLDETATPNDAFSRITLGNKRYGINLYVKYEDGTPASGINIQTTADVLTGSKTTNADGYLFLVQDKTSFMAKVQDSQFPKDLKTNAEINIELSDTITNANMILERNEDVITVTSSGAIYFTPSATSVDICCVGGGGAGFDPYNTLGASGGGGGYTQNQIRYSLSGLSYLIVSIGAGGNRISAGGGGGQGDNGGRTSVGTSSSDICSANGGGAGTYSSGGIGSGNGGNATNSSYNHGSSSNTYIFNEQSLGLAGGGGGGSGNCISNIRASGGQPFGADGSSLLGPAEDLPLSSYGGGGAGGTMANTGSYHQLPSNGMKGVVYLRFHH